MECTRRENVIQRPRRNGLDTMPTKRISRRQDTVTTGQTLTATIDLHGYRKSEGIIALTSFLDLVVSRQRQQKQQQNDGDIWVLVITGSGAHSSEGPVLRTAVQNVLEKRQMHFVMNRGKGSFTVKANSGIVFYEPGPPVDTKIIVKDSIEVIPTLPKRPPRLPNDRILLYEDDAPTPIEVAVTDNAIEASKREHQEIVSEQKKEELLLKRAVSMSLIQAQKENEEEQQLMQRALSMSLLDTHTNDRQIDEDLQRVLEISQKDFQRDCHEDDDDELQRALELSQKIASRADEELLQILELSKKEYDHDVHWDIGVGTDVDDNEFSQQENL